MSNLAIHTESLGKAYQIARHTTRSGYKTLQEDIIGFLRQPLRRAQTRETFWALKDISFDVQHGQVLGIIGRNGAGKSTLLKILSRITQPTTGEADIYGRLGSLLEVGTGFHPELTGRENIFLNGAVLGMSRRDIRRHFDEIVDFAEVERFLDTPVKRYSSGMYMRLAFAVAAHLEPEVLVIDEVLAVGDAEFQKKCLGKMGDVARSGRTVLFVSHNMAAVQQLCTAGIVLDRGQIVYSGVVSEAVAHYIRLTSKAVQSTELRDRRDRQGDGSLRFTRVEICDNLGHPIETVLSGQDIRIRFYYETATPSARSNVNIAFNIYSPQGVLLTHLNTRDTAQMVMSIGETGYLECEWPHFNLRSGVYTCALFCEINGTIVDWLQSAFQIHVEDGDFFGTGSLVDRSQGDILVNYRWSSHPAIDEALPLQGHS